MSTMALDDKHMKELLKQALVELIQERRDLFSDLFEEIIEDVGLANAIREGRATDFVSEEEIKATLAG